MIGMGDGVNLPEVGGFIWRIDEAFLDGMGLILFNIPIDEAMGFFAIDHDVFSDGVGFIGEGFTVLLESAISIFDGGFGFNPDDIVDEFEACFKD